MPLAVLESGRLVSTRRWMTHTSEKSISSSSQTEAMAASCSTSRAPGCCSAQVSTICSDGTAIYRLPSMARASPSVRRSVDSGIPSGSLSESASRIVMGTLRRFSTLSTCSCKRLFIKGIRPFRAAIPRGACVRISYFSIAHFRAGEKRILPKIETFL